MSFFKKAAASVKNPFSSLFKKEKKDKKSTFAKPSEDVSTAAQLANAAYTMDDNVKNRKKKANAQIKDTGYEVVKNLSDAQISTFKNADGTYNIAHKGTDIGGSTGFSDVMSDLKLMGGGHSQQTKDRTKQTKKIIKKIRRDDPNAVINMSGHSYGGATATKAMTNNFINKNVNQLDSFNAGLNPLKNTFDFDKGEKKKVTQHRTKGDVVSIGGALGGSKNQGGNVVEYKNKEGGTLGAHKLTNFF